MVVSARSSTLDLTIDDRLGQKINGVYQHLKQSDYMNIQKFFIDLKTLESECRAQGFTVGKFLVMVGSATGACSITALEIGPFIHV